MQIMEIVEVWLICRPVNSKGEPVREEITSSEQQGEKEKQAGSIQTEAEGGASPVCAYNQIWRVKIVKQTSWRPTSSLTGDVSLKDKSWNIWNHTVTCQELDQANLGFLTERQEISLKSQTNVFFLNKSWQRPVSLLYISLHLHVHETGRYEIFTNM